MTKIILWRSTHFSGTKCEEETKTAQDKYFLSTRKRTYSWVYRCSDYRVLVKATVSSTIWWN